MSDEKMENVITGVGCVVGIGVGIICGGAAATVVLSKLPEAVTTVEKVRNYAVASGTAVAVQKVVSDAVVEDVQDTLAFIGGFVKSKKKDDDKKTETETVKEN